MLCPYRSFKHQPETNAGHVSADRSETARRRQGVQAAYDEQVSVNKSYLRQSVDIVMNAFLVSDFRQCKEFICLSHVGNFRG